MSYLSLLLISISLAMDAFAVSVSAGFTLRKVLFKQALILAATFGVFQAIMPLIGWIGWLSIRSFIEPIDHWVAFILLAGLGSRMIYEALQDEDEEKRDYLSIKSLLTLGLATSIDALAVGISLALLPVNILMAVSMIGIVTAVICLAGVYLWARFWHIFEKKAEIAGGLILIAIGTKILLEHTIL